jgi:hypothetical protein
MTSEQLAATSGIVLSLVFSYVPGLSAVWDKATPVTKRLVMAFLLLVIAAVIYLFACTNVPEMAAGVTCTRESLLQLVNVFIAALIANQAAYMISPK